MGQDKHSLAAEAPVVVRYLPAAQFVHEVAPVSGLYVPTAHEVQTVAASPEYLPAAQAVHASRPEDEDKVPAAHDVQETAFEDDAYVPATQLEQAVEPVFA